MASLMESYEQQYSNITAEIVSNTGQIPQLTGSEKHIAIRNVERLLEETKELLEQMEIETRQSKDREKYQTRLKSYKTELSKLERDFKRARIAFTDDVHIRDELLGVDDLHQIEDQRARLLDNTERLERSGRQLEAGYKTCLETEQMGAQVLEDLNQQRNTINRARDKLRDTNEALGKSSRILSTMFRRALHNRLILIALVVTFILFIILGILLVVWRH